MSNSKLRKHSSKAARSEEPKKYSLQRTPALLSDSKGKYLKSVVNIQSSLEKEILWFCKSGASSTDTYHWLCRNINKLVESHVSLYVWVGTCDLTSKERSSRYISLRNPDQALRSLKSNLRKIKEHCILYEVPVTFIHIPYYSISRWNQAKGHQHPETFRDNDLKLTELVDSTNSFIDDLNSQLNTYSPKINQDLIRSRKGASAKARYSINFNLFKDGIHPGENLAKSWLTSLVKKFTKDCVSP